MGKMKEIYIQIMEKEAKGFCDCTEELALWEKNNCNKVNQRTNDDYHEEIQRENSRRKQS